MALSAYNGDCLLHVFEEPITFPLEFGTPDSRHHAIALGVARKSHELPPNEEIIRFSNAVGCKWYVYDPFDRDEYFASIFPQLIAQAIASDQSIHFNLTDIRQYHETTLRELQYLVRNTTTLDSTTFYERHGDRYVMLVHDLCRPRITSLLQTLDA